MLYNAEILSERLSQHSKDYKQGKAQDLAQICKDCEVASNMIKKLKTSKRTKKRKAQRLEKRNKELREKIEKLEAELKVCNEALDNSMRLNTNLENTISYLKDIEATYMRGETI